MEDKNPIKIRLLTVILLFIIFILILCIIFMYGYFKNTQLETNSDITATTKNVSSDRNTLVETNTTKTPENSISSEYSDNNSKVVDLNIEDAQIKKLYNYIMKPNHNQEILVYRNNKITLSDLNNQLKLITIFENVNKKDASNTKSLTDDYGVTTTHTYYKKDYIENMAKKVFGSNVTINHESCEAFFTYARDYTNNMYDCYNYQGGGTTPWETSTSKLIKAEQIGDEIYLYDKYVHIVEVENIVNGINNSGTFDIYSASDKQVKLSSNVDFSKNNLYSNNDIINNVEKYLNKDLSTFKHTFKKSSDGDYYWYSTEPIE